MKTEFPLILGGREKKVSNMSAFIQRYRNHDMPIVIFRNPDGRDGYIPKKDLERFAVNILKALNSKRLKK